MSSRSTNVSRMSTSPRDAAHISQVSDRIGRVVQHAEEQHNVEHARGLRAQLLDGQLKQLDLAVEQLLQHLDVVLRRVARPGPYPVVVSHNGIAPRRLASNEK